MVNPSSKIRDQTKDDGMIFYACCGAADINDCDVCSGIAFAEQGLVAEESAVDFYARLHGDHFCIGSGAG